MNYLNIGAPAVSNANSSTTIEKCMPIIWVALAIIAASGLSISLLSYFSYLPINVGYAGIAISGTSLSALVLSYVFRPNSLKQAMKVAKTFKELRGLIEQPEIEIKVSFFGSRNVSVKGIMGGISLNDVAQKVEKMVGERKFSYTEEERVEGEALVKSITNLFEKTDEELKSKNFITRFFHSCYTLPSQIIYTATIHNRWFDMGSGADSWFHNNPSERPKKLLSWFA